MNRLQFFFHRRAHGSAHTYCKKCKDCGYCSDPCVSPQEAAIDKLFHASTVELGVAARAEARREKEKERENELLEAAYLVLDILNSPDAITNSKLVLAGNTLFAAVSAYEPEAEL